MRTLAKFTLVFLTAMAWVFSSFPQGITFPPSSQQAEAATTPTRYPFLAGGLDVGGACDWVNFTNAAGNDTNDFATCSTNKTTNVLRLYNFGFTAANIPEGAIIEGITVNVEWNETTSSMEDLVIRLMTDTQTPIGNNKALGTPQPSKAFRTYGGATDNWGAGLTRDDIVDTTGFGLYLQYDHPGGGPAKDLNVYRANITIDYSIPDLTVLGDAANESSQVIGPGASATSVGQFTFNTSAGTDSVTAMTVDLTPTGAFNNIAEVKITSDDELTTYFSSVSNPASNTINFSGGTPIPVTTTTTTYKIMVTPKTHPNMPPPPGASYGTRGSVTSYTSINAQAGSDTVDQFITIDNLAPANVTSATTTAGDTEVELNWTNPIFDFIGEGQTVVLRRAESAVADVPVEGASYTVGDTIGTATVACVLSGSPPGISCTDTGLTNGTNYHYEIFTKDPYGNYASGTVPTESPIAPVGPSYEQSAYRLFDNVDGTDVGSALAAQDTPATLALTGSDFRMRLLMHIGSADLLTSKNRNFKLQFAEQSGTCDTGFSGETYSDVTTSSLIAYNDNGTPSDGDDLTANGNDPVHSAHSVVNQTYEELNNFTNSVADIPVGQDGKWDFSLIDNGAAAETSYCLRVVHADNNLLDTYSVIPEITTPAITGPTTIISDSYSPTSDTIGPGEGTERTLNHFALETTEGQDSITEMTITLEPEGAYNNISELYITYYLGTESEYFSPAINPTSNTINFSGGTPIPVYTNDFQYRLVIIPKNHADMPAPPGESYDITGDITSFTSTNPQIGSTTSSTITIDNGSPGSVTGTATTVFGTTILLQWTNPTDPDFTSGGEVVILRRIGNAVTDVPVEGEDYLAGNFIGDSTVACVLSSLDQECADQYLDSGTTYHYKIFTKDSYGNYDTGVVPTDSPATAGIGGPPGGGAPGGSFDWLELWLKADESVFTDGGVPATNGDSVREWADLRWGYNATERTPGASDNVTYVANSEFNFNPAINFDGTADRPLVNASFSRDTGSGTSLFVVAQSFSQLAGGNAFLESNDNASRGFFLNTRYNSSTEYTPPLPLNEKYIASIRDTGGLNGPANFIKNGFIQDTFAKDFDSDFSNGRYVIGDDDDGGNPFDGQIPEIIIYGYTLDDYNQRERVDSYLALKYGITLDQSASSGGTNYLDSQEAVFWEEDPTDTYEHDIFGIARDSASELDQRISRSSNDDSIITIALDNDFTSANNDPSRTTGHDSSIQSLMLANDDAPMALQTTELDTNTYDERIGREWRVRRTANFTQQINMKFDGFDDSYELLVDNDGDFSSGATSLGALDANGEILNVDLYNSQYITLARVGGSPPPPQTLSFSISDNTVGFGTLSSSSTRYADGTGVGQSSTAVPAHTISASTNATNGYTISMDGTEFSCINCTPAATIDPITGTLAAPQTGIEQFGINAELASGTGSVVAPYSTASEFYYEPNVSDTILSGPGDDTESIYNMNYMTNIATVTEAGDYEATITYTITASF